MELRLDYESICYHFIYLVLFRFLLVILIRVFIANSVVKSYEKIQELPNRIALLEFKV